MHMIWHSTNFNGQAIDFIDNAANIGKDAWKIVFAHVYTCAFDMKYQMYINFY